MLNIHLWMQNFLIQKMKLLNQKKCMSKGADFVLKINITSLLQNFSDSSIENLYEWAKLLDRLACAYDEKDSIGKRYRRQDAVGTPFCVTVDHQTLADNCVTIRHRDTMEQQRVAISDLHAIIGAEVNMKNLFKKIVE